MTYPKHWPAIGEQMTPPIQPKEIRERLNAIVVRRNMIVHEGDYERRERPREPKLNRTTEREARADIDFIAQLVNAIHTVI
jgi:hypothetical protein